MNITKYNENRTYALVVVKTLRCQCVIFNILSYLCLSILILTVGRRRGNHLHVVSTLLLQPSLPYGCKFKLTQQQKCRTYLQKRAVVMETDERALALMIRALTRVTRFSECARGDGPRVGLFIQDTERKRHSQLLISITSHFPV